MIYIVILILVAVVAITIAVLANNRYNDLVKRAAKLSQDAVSLKEQCEQYLSSAEHLRLQLETEQQRYDKLNGDYTNVVTENEAMKAKLSRKGTGRKGSKKKEG